MLACLPLITTIDWTSFGLPSWTICYWNDMIDVVYTDNSHCQKILIKITPRNYPTHVVRVGYLG